MPFHVTVDSSISLDDLVARSRTTGAVIVRTPHVGNVTGHTLGLAALGLRMLLYDRTLGRRDVSCHPHLVITGGAYEPIADPAILTTHARVTAPSSRVRMGERVTDVHLRPLRRAYPDQRFCTYTEFVGEHADRVLRILGAVTEAMPSLWRRRVDAAGHVQRAAVLSWKDLLREGIFGVTSQTEGWLIPNELNVLLTCTVESAGRDVDWAILMAGIDMIRYMTAYEMLLAHLYDVARRREPGLSLPESFRCFVSPVYRVRFHIRESDQWILDEMIALYGRILRQSAAIRRDAAGGRPPGISLIAVRKQSVDALHDFFAVHLQTLAWNIFYDSRAASYFTQHDLGEGERVRIHPWAVQASVAENHAAYRFLGRHFELVRRMASRRDPLRRRALDHRQRADAAHPVECA